jgi:hypothetical protein
LLLFFCGAGLGSTELEAGQNCEGDIDGLMVWRGFREKRVMFEMVE